MSLVSELRRRQVFRAVAWYGGLAWLAVEVANTVFPRFGLPEWSIRAVIVAAALGLPIALALAWSFDLSVLGLRREVARTEPERPIVAAHAAPLWRIPSFWIALVLGAGLAVSAQQAWQRLIRPAFDERPGLAVLPFANLSPDPENAYFADGLHEEILATFARAGGLRVISRTSVQEYRDAKRNLRKIADALDVSLILEGSVRREGDDLRLTLQLIDGRTDEHLWAETYDRKFRDALRLQRTVAEQVVAAIGATLTPTEQRLIADSSPSNPEAYEFYLHALTRWHQFASEPDLRVLLGFLDRTIALDPDFALAHALRAKARVWLAANYTESTRVTASEAARADIERALELQPDLPEALAARGLYMTYITRDAARGLEDLTRAIALAPNDPDTRNVAGLTLRRLGRFDEAINQFREAARLAPTETQYLRRSHETLISLGRIDEARKESQTLMRRFPDFPNPYLHPYVYECFQTGRAAAGWREELERRESKLEARSHHNHRWMLLACEGDMTALASFAEQATAAETFSGSRDFDLGVVLAALPDSQRARPHLEAVAEQITLMTDDSWALAQGAVALELLGRGSEALHAADESARRSAADYDAVNGPSLAMLRAWVLIRSESRAEEGYAELERSLGAFDVLPGWVAADPLWRILRDDARTQRIIREAMPERPS